MKKLLLIIPALLFSLLTFSQGIVFEQGTWKEVLAKAQQTNKPIFVDIYTTWCGPCKQMSSNIFPLETVGKVFNENFICYQIDAEKGEGIAIAKKYGVKAYPTYIFVKGDGTLFYISLGSMPAKDFIAVSKAAISEMNDPKPLAVWDREYIIKKNDTTFLKEYITKRSKLGLTNTQIFDEYLKLLPEGERTNATVINWYRKEGPHMKVNTFSYLNMQKNSEKIYSSLASYVYFFLLDGIINTVNEASVTKNEPLLATAISAYDQLPKYSYSIQKDEVYMQYYKNTGETDKYLKYAINHGNSYLMKKSVDSINQKDKNYAQILEETIKSGAFKMMDSSRIAALRSAALHMDADKFSQKLNQIARYVFENTTDKNILQYALAWSKRSLEISLNNSTFLDTYANLFYKLGLKQEAIANEKEALRLADKKDVEGYKGMEETLRKMNAGEKTWK